LDEEHVRAAESSNKRTFAIVIGVVLLVVVAFVIWIQFGTHENTYDQGTAQPESPVEEAAPVLDVAEQKRLFETAMEQGRLIAPFGNCALSVMELMKKEAPNAPEYEQMRKAFVERLATGAEAADAAGDLNLARTLAGYGAQWDPENAALKKRADELQARYVGNFNAAQGAQAADAGTADVAVVPAEPAPTDVKVEETKPVEEVKPAEPAKVEVKTTQTAAVTKVETKTQPPLETAPAVDTRQMLKDASAAYARGDVAAARQLYLELVKVDGGNHLVQSGMGQVYFDQAQYNDAVRHQLQAVKLKPSRTDYRVNLGQSYFRLGRFKEAIAAWEEVLRQDPNNANAKQYIELAKRKMN
jgi:tetratricopeptide (TPR) repeat protein